MAWFQLVANGDATDPNNCIITSLPTPVLNTSLRTEMITALKNKDSTHEREY
ncbi:MULTISPECIES: hypothetical protein [Sphingobacterium]|uniref:hypothetical protein n=1 Tax=Sphingobacterium TaxID=28453 RepID=UPI00257AB3F4|nr:MULTISPECIES: hypothetical protein [Sphingobacterium]